MPPPTLEDLSIAIQVVADTADMLMRAYPLAERRRRAHAFTYELMASWWGGFPGFVERGSPEANAVEQAALPTFDTILRSMDRRALPRTRGRVRPSYRDILFSLEGA
jgi:hypothetical protein